MGRKRDAEKNFVRKTRKQLDVNFTFKELGIQSCEKEKIF